MAGLNAITFIVDDMAVSCAFWRAAGFEVAYGDDQAAFTSWRAGGDTFVNLARADPPRPAGPTGPTESTGPVGPAPGYWGRVIIHVDDPDETHRVLLAAGYSPHEEPRDAPWGERYFHITDPDGNEISFARLLASHHG